MITRVEDSVTSQAQSITIWRNYPHPKSLSLRERDFQSVFGSLLPEGEGPGMRVKRRLFLTIPLKS
jgi:hypothetical protein